VDKTGRYPFGASYRGHVISLNGIGADGDVAAEPLQVILAGRNAHSIRTDGSNCFVYLPPRHGPEFPVQLRRSPRDTAVLSVTSIQAGDAYNVISQTAVMRAVRSGHSTMTP
jgi:metal-dependent amidase/aminoacylase/carboxypeptidase family protein